MAAADPQDRTSRSGLWLTLALALLAAVLGWFNGLGRVDQILYDRAVSVTGRGAPSRHHVPSRARA